MVDQDKSRGDIENGKAHRMRTLSVIGSELLFVLIPFIVIAAISLYKCEPLRLFYASEWSFAAVILIGQASIKFVSGFLSRGESLRWERIALIATVLIVLLVVSVLVLAFVLLADPLSSALVIVQIVWFVIALVVFLVLGALGQSLIS